MYIDGREWQVLIAMILLVLNSAILSIISRRHSYSLSNFEFIISLDATLVVSFIIGVFFTDNYFHAPFLQTQRHTNNPTELDRDVQQGARLLFVFGTQFYVVSIC